MKYCLIFLGLHFLLLACNKDWLDQKPDVNISVPNSLKNLEAMLDGQTMYSSPLTLGDISTDGHTITPASWRVVQNYKRISYIWEKDRPNINNFSWNGAYSLVLYCNIILEELDKLKLDDEVSALHASRIRGAALFQRARIFYELAQIWAPPYDPGTATADLGIPLRVESNIDASVARASIKETYDLIISDMKSSIGLLPEKTIFPNQPSKLAAYALMARIFLSMEKYDMALAFSDSCLSRYSVLIDYNKLSTSSSNVGLYNPEVIFHSVNLNGATSVPAGDFIDTSFFNSYHEHDLRKTVFFRKNSSGNITFKGNYNNSTNELFTGLAVDEMYLNRAESYARLGRVVEAMNDLNTLLKSRWKNSVPYPVIKAQNSEEALKIILEERKKELFLRGQRWIDLRRLNRDARFRISISRIVDGKTYNLEPESYKYVMPIPDDVLEYSGIQQNNGWD